MNWEIFAYAASSIAVILGGVWFIVRHAFKAGSYAHRLDAVDERTRFASCGTRAAEIKEHGERLAIVREDIAALKVMLSARTADISAFSVKHSPRRLNEAGERIFKEMGGDEFINANKAELFKRIGARCPKTALDVEAASYAVCAALTETDLFNGVKEYVYNAPALRVQGANGETLSKDITLSDACFVISIPLRDLYLSEHGEINV